MDIFTPKGQASLEQENIVMDLFHSRYPQFKYCPTDKDSPARIDGVIIKDNTVYAVVETKSRPSLTYDHLVNKFGNKILITAQKIEDGVIAAQLLHVPFVIFMYLVPDQILLILKIWTPKDGFIVPMECKVTETKRTVNGGVANRLNAFIPMDTATMIRANQ